MCHVGRTLGLGVRLMRRLLLDSVFIIFIAYMCADVFVLVVVFVFRSCPRAPPGCLGIHLFFVFAFVFFFFVSLCTLAVAVAFVIGYDFDVVVVFLGLALGLVLVLAHAAPDILIVLLVSVAFVSLSSIVLLWGQAS